MGADAIHPGYGFLSENADFAQACKDNNIIFIGPEVSVLKSLGDKVTAKTVAVKNNVPVIQSNEKDLESLDIAIEEANRIGYPIMLKAASGGGGRGMRVLREEAELRKAFSESKREALNAFGDDTVFIEKFIENPIASKFLRLLAGKEEYQTIKNHIYPIAKGGIYNLDNGDGITRGAPAIITIHAPKDAEAHSNNGIIYATYIMLAANAI